MNKKKRQWIILFFVLAIGFISGIGLMIYKTENIQFVCNSQHNIQSAHIDNIEYRFIPGEKKLEIYGVDGINKITGSSMRPTFFSDNRVFYRRYSGDPSELKEGQIVTFSFENQTGITHRIFSLYSDHIITVGDNNEVKERINYSDVDYLILGGLYT